MSISFEKLLKPFIFSLFFFVIIYSIRCIYTNNNRSDQAASSQQLSGTLSLIKPEGTIIETRFGVPDGFERIPVAQHLFGDYLRHLPLKKAGTKVKYYNGKEKDDYAYEAVVNMDIGHQNLQQCADAVMRLRGEYFYSKKNFDSISFTLTNGFIADYSKWITGNRIQIIGNETRWIKTSGVSDSYPDFRKYMDVVFTYAGTLSLSKTLHSKRMQDLTIGDVFIVGGSPGHAVIVADVAQNKKGEKIFMLAQSYMPAQEIQVLKNLDDNTLSAWYRNDFAGDLRTPEWTFTKAQLKTW